MKPKDVYHIVMSVPHSGTRTLQQWLADELGLRWEGRDTVGQWHFHYHPHYVSKFFMYAKADPGKRMAYFPVRNPIDVCDSWERRYKDDGAHNAFNMTNAIGIMVAAWVTNPEHIKLYKMEDLPVLRGHGPNPEGWNKLSPEHHRVVEVRQFIRDIPEVEGFYRSLYTPEELWWL